MTSWKQVAGQMGSWKQVAGGRADDKLEAYPTERATMTRRPDTGRVILSVAAQPGAMGLVDLTEFPRHETKVKLLAILPPGERQALPPGHGENGTGPIYRNGPEGAAHKSDLSRFPPSLPPGYPLAQPVHLYLSGKASDAAKDFFAFLAEGNAPDALLAHGVVPRGIGFQRVGENGKLEARRGDANYGLEAHPTKDDKLEAYPTGDDKLEAYPTGFRDVAEDTLKRELQQDDPFRLPDAEGGVQGEQPGDQSGGETGVTTVAETGSLRPPLAESDGEAQSAGALGGAADGFDAWARANAMPLVLVSLAALLLAVALGTVAVKRNRRHNDLLRRYRS